MVNTPSTFTDNNNNNNNDDVEFQSARDRPALQSSSAQYAPTQSQQQQAKQTNYAVGTDLLKSSLSSGSSNNENKKIAGRNQVVCLFLFC